MRSLLLFVLELLLLGASVASGQENNKLVLLNPDSCVVLNGNMIGKLPEAWKKYGEFIKACSLYNHGAERVDLVSIWIFDYYKTKFKDASAYKWEAFPLPLIVDEKFKVLTELPEHYPDDPPRELDIFFSKGTAFPSMIQIKVYNPAVSGDYSYPTLMWDNKTGVYLPSKK